MRYAYRMEGMPEKRVILPSLERPKTLPVVLSKEEIKLLLKTPKLLKHRLVIGMLYGCGLRCFELQKLLLKDLDFDRGMVHIRQGKKRSLRSGYVSTIFVFQGRAPPTVVRQNQPPR